MKQAGLLNVAPHYPFLCQWEITCRCNLRCVMCYTDCFNTPAKIKNELSTAEIVRIMDQLADAGCLELTLTGGEPLMRADFFEIYSHAKSRGFLVTLFTNATLLTDAIADRLADQPPVRVEVSFHGATEASFDAITQLPGAFGKCQAAIRRLVDRRVPVVLKTTAMTVNEHEVLAVKRFADSLGGGVIHHIGEHIRGALDGDVAPLRFQLSPARLEHLEQQDTKMWGEACARRDGPRYVCPAGRQTFHIDAYGQLQRCSSNRLASYDLRHGSFGEGFLQLSGFPCPLKSSQTIASTEARA